MRSRALVVAVGLMALVGLVACEGETSTPAADPGGETSAPAGDGGTAGQLTISGSAFSPSSVTAGEGGALTITNEDGFAHTFTMDDGSVDEEVAAGATVDVTITTAGPFHCSIHPTMTGTVSLG